MNRQNARAPHKGLQQPLKAAPLHAESMNQTLGCDTIRMTSGSVLTRGFPYKYDPPQKNMMDMDTKEQKDLLKLLVVPK